MNERDKLIEQLIKEKGGTRKDYLQLLDSIAYHESAHTMDPSIKQQGGGPGRGVYQFETGTNAGGITAARRTKQYYEKIGQPIPTWLNNVIQKDSLDASTLTREQQDALFLGNMRQHPKADFAKVWSGEESIPDFWANYHWAGDDKDRKIRLKSFNNSYDNFNETNSTNPTSYPITSPPPQVDSTLEGRPQKPITMESFVDYTQGRLAMGGAVNQMDYADKEVNAFGSGGTHEQNPLGGIPQGMGANGKPNSVEEDEASYNFKQGKFIFSNRIKYEK